MEKVYEFKFNGKDATILIPENFNGKWIWKAEYFHAFEDNEVALYKQGYARVYFANSIRFGSYKAIREMHAFHRHIIKEYGLCQKCILFGFSIGGIYSFNYALSYPDYVEKVYLDAPVLNIDSWPRKIEIEKEQLSKMLECYNLNLDTLKTFNDSPIHNLKEFFDTKIPVLLVAGDSDEVVNPDENYKIMLDYCKKNNIDIEVHIKKGCLHHPHSLEDLSIVSNFVNK